jgi:hypothetical protein
MKLKAFFFSEEGHEKRRNLTAQETVTREINGKKKESLLYKKMHLTQSLKDL